MITVNCTDGLVFVGGDFGSVLGFVKSLEGRSYNGVLKQWNVPMSQKEFVGMCSFPCEIEKKEKTKADWAGEVFPILRAHGVSMSGEVPHIIVECVRKKAVLAFGKRLGLTDDCIAALCAVSGEEFPIAVEAECEMSLECFEEEDIAAFNAADIERIKVEEDIVLACVASDPVFFEREGL